MSNLKEWMKIVEEGSDSFDSDHSAENLVNYYDDENEKPDNGDKIDFEFGLALVVHPIQGKVCLTLVVHSIPFPEVSLAGVPDPIHLAVGLAGIFHTVRSVFRLGLICSTV